MIEFLKMCQKLQSVSGPNMQFLKALVGTCCFTRKHLSNEPGLKSWLG